MPETIIVDDILEAQHQESRPSCDKINRKQAYPNMPDFQWGLPR